MEPVREELSLVSEFLKGRGVAKPHLDSFNQFVNVDLKKIVDDNGFIELSKDDRFFLRILNARIGAPPVKIGPKDKTRTPLECRTCDLTYTAPIFADIEYSQGIRNEILTLKENQVEIGRMPIMLRSCCCILYEKQEAELAKLGECPLDPGGYFIVEGEEKVFLIQEEHFDKGITVSSNGEGIITASVTSSKDMIKRKTIITMHDKKLWVQSDQFTKIPLMVVMKAMGMDKDEVIQMIGRDPCYASLLEPSNEECKKEGVLTKRKALAYLKSKGATAALPFLRDVFLPEVSVMDGNFLPKCIFVAAMVRRIMDAYQNKDALDEKEFIGNIRLKLPGELLSLLFEDLFHSWINDVKKMSEKKLAMWASKKQDKYGLDIVFRMTDFLYNGDMITHGLELTLKTGNFNVKRFKMQRTGVTQVLRRSSYVSAFAHMTNVLKQSEKSRNVNGAKAMHYSQFGMLCPCDIRVKACGIVRSLALMTHVTTDVEKDCSIDTICNGVQPITTLAGIHLHEPDSFLVIYNGVILGRHGNPQLYANCIREARRSGRISKFLSVHVNEKQCCVYLASDGGRVCRPLIIVAKGISRIKDFHVAELKEGKRTFESFVEDALVEYLDVNEANNALIALSEQDVSLETTHIEIEPFSILGVSAGIIPYPHHNHSSGNFKQCVLGKKAIGNIAYNQLLRMDPLLSSLVYPQRPLLTTKSIELLGYDKIGGGQNAIVAVMSYSGHDTNDAIVMNKSSIDRGFGRSTIMKTNTIIKQNYDNCTSDRFCPPTRDTAGRIQILDNDGIAAPGRILRPGDIYINKESPIDRRTINKGPREMPDGAYQSTAQTFNGHSDETVDRVVLYSNQNKNMSIKFRTRRTHRPEVGDQFSCRHGQKGICGTIVQQENMPFSENGICPDLIINPHGFPSGMTIGKMIELLGGKAGALCHKFHYGNAFGEGSGHSDSVETIGKTLIGHHFDYGGTDFMYSGITGCPLQAYIFMGPIYYQTLKHRVVDKMRALGLRDARFQTLTKQPVAGQRIGEMERDCLIACGASMLIFERLLLYSDPFDVHVCRKCGLLGYYNHQSEIAYCSSCKDSSNISTMKLPYAFKLLIQELQSMNIVPRLTLVDAQD